MSPKFEIICNYISLDDRFDGMLLTQLSLLLWCLYSLNINFVSIVTSRIIIGQKRHRISLPITYNRIYTNTKKMNNSMPLLRRLLINRPLHHHYSTTPTPSLAMKPGTPIPGLSQIYPPSKDPSTSNAPTALPREEYPSWVSDLAVAPPTLAKLRNIKMEEASDGDMRRYLKLVRRNLIKENNAIAGI